MDKAGWLLLTKRPTFQPKGWVPVGYQLPLSSKPTRLVSAQWFWGWDFANFPTVPCQRAFYLILPIGGTGGRGEGEKREDTSLFFMTPPLPPCEHLPAVAPGGNLLSFSISGSSLSVFHRGSSSSWMEPFPSALRASSAGLLLWARS